MPRYSKEFLRFAGSEARKLARQGKLVDETFKAFRQAVYPDATPDQIAALRVAFFAGAQEIMIIMMVALEGGEDATDQDLEFMNQWTGEIERFHERTIAASKAKTDRRN